MDAAVGLGSAVTVQQLSYLQYVSEYALPNFLFLFISTCLALKFRILREIHYNMGNFEFPYKYIGKPGPASLVDKGTFFS